MRSEIEIERPAEQVFDLLQDGNRSAQYINGEFTITPVRQEPSHDGIFRLGSVAHGQAAFLGQKLMTLEYRVVELQEDRLVRLETRGGKFNSVVRWGLKPVDENQTKVSLEVSLEPSSGPLALMKGVMHAALDPVLDQYLANSLLKLKKIMEIEALASVA